LRSAAATARSQEFRNKRAAIVSRASDRNILVGLSTLVGTMALCPPLAAVDLAAAGIYIKCNAMIAARLEDRAE
jgi:hypothetical protein